MMKHLSLSFCWMVCIAIFQSCQQNQSPVYKNANLPVEDRVQDLLSRMSLEEKIRQMDMYSGADFKENEAFSAEKTQEQLGELGVGAIHDLYPKDAVTINQLQQYVIDHNRHGIPALILCEFLHGYLGEGSTALPMNIALGATWDSELLQKAGQVIGTEGRAFGVHFGLGPNLDLGREPRWGRIAETFGEDPYLAAHLGSALIRGIQGDSLTSNRAMIAEPKHFAVHGVPQAGGNSSPVELGRRIVRQDYLPVFEKAFKEGGALGTMAAYTELDGVPCAANQWLLTDVLRKEWGFKGIVVSDLGAIRFLENVHYVSDSPKESVRQAIEAGIDMQFYDFPTEDYQRYLLELVQEGKISEERIDQSAGNVLRLKFLLGLFENPFTEQQWIDERHHSQAHQEVALEAGLKSICLLKNQNKVLPLSKSLKNVAVIGPLANESVLGGYSVKKKKAITVYEGIKAHLPEANVRYENGTPLIFKGQAISQANLWTPDQKERGLKAEYFANRHLKGEPTLTQVDPQVDFHWPGSPGEGMPEDQFSVRWTGYLKPVTSFSGWIGVSSDDGVRLWVDDVLVIDNWSKGSTNIATSPMEFKAGKAYKIKLEMWEGGYGAKAQLLWDLKKVDFQPAVHLARQSDVAVVVLGESEELVEENKDVASLDLFGNQEELIKAIQATGTPVVCVLLNGRPLSVNWINQHVPAVVEAWFPGEKLGEAVAKVLFGDYNPAGRLPVTFPRSVGQLPFYYNQKPSAIHRYNKESHKPLYEFGYGLSYTSFEYSNLKITGQEANYSVSVTVTNTGDRDGEEVVQLYLNDVRSSVTTPRRTLKGFQRVMIEKGQSKEITFQLTPEDLSLWNRDMQRVVEAGEFEVFVGGNQHDGLEGKFEVKKDVVL
ncbi:glycoside hydrolase family 3 N-terminal domain-containing protein [Rapidithrix thailandica]|uniref:Glycoside hydrolase family 3 N-terminal domain-containing protein n=1 Tax=Rapidithrix thailandica TaxID=413964 RepID=A0AAW9SDI2_9BACT